jgi:hypothetical protein
MRMTRLAAATAKARGRCAPRSEARVLLKEEVVTL